MKIPRGVKKLFLKFLICFVFISKLILLNISEAQICEGSWSIPAPYAQDCLTGVRLISNVGEPPGCPINPSYGGPQINTFTFSNTVNSFLLDFGGFSSIVNCARMQVKINGIFYPLTAANLIAIPSALNCTGSFSFVAVTADGYITGAGMGNVGYSGQGRIIINGVTATSITISTNDALGVVVTNPFNCNTIVPLDLLGFQGSALAPCKSILNWQTGTELNIKNIEVESSIDGHEFKKVGEVMPTGDNSRYSFETNNFSNSYFRLKINDLDWNYKYSEIIKINTACNNQAYMLMSNPANNTVEIEGLQKDDGILFFDMSGRKVMTLTPSQYNTKFNIQKLPPGMYVLQIINAGVIKGNIKLIKK